MEEQPMGVEAQLAVLRTKMDQLIDLSKTRGEDHEQRLRRLEENAVTKKAAYSLIIIVCTVSAAVTNALALWLK